MLSTTSFPHLNVDMTNNICRFLATPSPVFELQAHIGQENVSIQQFAIVRLAQCVQVIDMSRSTICPQLKFTLWIRRNLLHKSHKLLYQHYMHCLMKSHATATMLTVSLNDLACLTLTQSPVRPPLISLMRNKSSKSAPMPYLLL